MSPNFSAARFFLFLSCSIFGLQIALSFMYFATMSIVYLFVSVLLLLNIAH